MTGRTHEATDASNQNRESQVAPRRAAREGCVMQWNGQSGVREYRAAPNARPDSHAPDEQPQRICIGEVCEPMS